MLEENKDLIAINLIKSGGSDRIKGVNILYNKYAKKLGTLFKGNKLLREIKITEADAEDLVQETFIKIVRGCETYKGEASLSTWIRKIAKHCLIDHLRSRQLPIEFDEEGWEFLENNFSNENIVERDSRASWLLENQIPDPSNDMETIEECVQRAFARFSKDDQKRAEALSLVVEGYEIKKIAKFINRTEGATREYLSQCRKKIEKYMSPCKELLSA